METCPIHERSESYCKQIKECKEIYRIKIFSELTCDGDVIVVSPEGYAQPYSEFTASELAGKRLDKGESQNEGVGSIVLRGLVLASEDLRPRLDQLML
ncbi:hypothetical protein POVWA2_097360 [Plasmodium ovale wallikeri]|uniref:Uncharacterized protein n=1 Tax=Plasmodium ovale wallikeri TaxID=864142 RepID=A0A1A9ARZ9_PLAOA|nr:hypothetical protein POVWA2_097360 [Plasmodium ovale wallikeri]